VSTLKKTVLIYGEVNVPSVVEYEIGDEPSFIVRGRIDSLNDRDAYDFTPNSSPAKKVRTRRFGFTAESVELNDDVLFVMDEEKVEEEPPVRPNRLRRFLAYPVPMWATLVYVGWFSWIGYTIGR